MALAALASNMEARQALEKAGESVIDIIVETPRGSRVKIKRDLNTGAYVIDRILPQGLREAAA